MRWPAVGALIALLGVLLGLIFKPGEPSRQSAAGSGPVAGQPAPDLVLPDLSGRSVRLSGFRGHPVALVFLATSSDDCRRAMPALVHAAQALQGRGLVMLGIDSAGERSSLISDFIRTYNVPFPILLDRTAIGTTSYDVRNLPTTIVVGPRGRIVRRLQGDVSATTLARIALKK